MTDPQELLNDLDEMLILQSPSLELMSKASEMIEELSAKLDKAREALSVALTWSDYGTDDTAEIMRCTDALRELDK